MRRGVLSGAFCFWAATAVAAEPKVYSGEEAGALRCANAMALTAVALSDAGLMTDAEKEVLLRVTVAILDRHVSGSWAQKKAALEVVRDRRNVGETLEDFQVLAQRCLRQYPIN